jgi:hypothetical protein
VSGFPFAGYVEGDNEYAVPLDVSVRLECEAPPAQMALRIPEPRLRFMRCKAVAYTALPSLLASGLIEWKVTVEPWQLDASKTYFGYDAAAPL